MIPESGIEVGPDGSIRTDDDAYWLRLRFSPEVLRNHPATVYTAMRSAVDRGLRGMADVESGVTVSADPVEVYVVIPRAGARPGMAKAFLLRLRALLGAA